MIIIHVSLEEGSLHAFNLENRPFFPMIGTHIPYLSDMTPGGSWIFQLAASHRKLLQVNIHDSKD